MQYPDRDSFVSQNFFHGVDVVQMNKRNFNPLTARQMNITFAELSRDLLNCVELLRCEVPADAFEPHGKIIWLPLAHEAAFLKFLVVYAQNQFLLNPMFMLPDRKPCKSSVT